MKKITFACDMNGKEVPIDFYIGEPEPKHHPIGHQASWLSKERGIMVPHDIMDEMARLHKQAVENNIPFDEYFAYSVKYANSVASKQEGEEGGQEG